MNSMPGVCLNWTIDEFKLISLFHWLNAIANSSINDCKILDLAPNFLLFVLLCWLRAWKNTAEKNSKKSFQKCTDGDDICVSVFDARWFRIRDESKEERKKVFSDFAKNLGCSTKQKNRVQSTWSLLTNWLTDSADGLMNDSFWFCLLLCAWRK